MEEDEWLIAPAPITPASMPISDPTTQLCTRLNRMNVLANIINTDGSSVQSSQFRISLPLMSTR